MDTEPKVDEKQDDVLEESYQKARQKHVEALSRVHDQAAHALIEQGRRMSMVKAPLEVAKQFIMLARAAREFTHLDTMITELMVRDDLDQQFLKTIEDEQAQEKAGE